MQKKKRKGREAVPIQLPDGLLKATVQARNEDLPYLQAYPVLMSAVRDNPIDSNGFVKAAHMVYAWMPAILKLKKKEGRSDFSTEAALIEAARSGKQLNLHELRELAASFGEAETSKGSIIGVSKLLHFANPEKYAIWDTRVLAYINYPNSNEPVDKPNYVTVNRIERYVMYLEALAELCRNKPQDVRQVTDRVNALLKEKGINHPVSQFRALELLMFSNAPAFKKKNKD